MNKEILEIITAAMTLISSVMGFFNEKKEGAKEQLPNYNQQQSFSHIQTKGDQSPVNIQAVQVQQSSIVASQQEYEIQDKKFKQRLARLKGYRRFFLIFLPVLSILIWSFADKQELSYSIDYIMNGIVLSIVIVCAITFGLIVKRIATFFYRRYKFNLSGNEDDIISKGIRWIEYYCYPLAIAGIQALILKFLFFDNQLNIEHTESMIFNILFLLTLYLISSYVHFLLYQFVVCGNIFVIRGIMIRIVNVTILFVGTIYISQIYNVLKTLFVS